MALGARSSLWGWGLPSRVLLTSVALLLAASLAGLKSPEGRRPAIDPTLAVDPNTAPPQVLLALPRLGPVLVGRIVAERERRPFRSLDDFDARVRGVGPATAAGLRPFLRFGPAPVAPDARRHVPE
ncbi:MAG: helix-hairpin-helix domain-containing protein [Planctomycetia bacterium]|nr:helix-hairpin-helix domain-containing protein [Planctomycetia bacterium]